MVKKICEISKGEILKIQINKKGKKNKNNIVTLDSFTKGFNEWLIKKQSEGEYIEQPLMDKRYLSRWINNKPKMKRDKIEMFADYFDVDPEYLECTQYSERRGDQDDPDILKENERLTERFEKEEALIRFLLCYSMDIMPSSIVTTQDDRVYRYVDDYVVYEVSKNIKSDIEKYEFLLPDGEKVEMTSKQLVQLIDDAAWYIECLARRIKDNNDQKTDQYYKELSKTFTKGEKRNMINLTFGEVQKLLEEIRSEHPTDNDSDLSQIELITYAYLKGYEAAKKKER